MIEKLYTVEDAAKLLNVATVTLRFWYYQGRVRGIKLGRRVMISEPELQRFIKAGMQQGIRKGVK